MRWNKWRYRRSLERIVRKWSEDYRRKAREAAELVVENLEKGMPTKAAVDAALAALKLDEHVRESMMDGLVHALADGYGILPRIVDVPRMRRTFLHTVWAADRISLSARLHGASQETRRLVVGTIRESMKRGEACVTLARKLYDGYGYGHVSGRAELPKYLDELQARAGRLMSGAVSPEDLKGLRRLLAQARRNVEALSSGGAPTKAQQAAYLQLVKAVEKGSKKALERAVHVAIEERSRYHAERIARTEMARAYAEGFHAKHDGDPDIVGYKWTLGTRHPRFDICDFHASADLYGMGPGIYPKDKTPKLPAHPHCLCRLVEVFVDEVPSPSRFLQEHGRECLEKMSEKERRALLGVRGTDMFRQGGDWRKHLRGWEKERPFENRFGRAMQFFAFDPEEERRKIRGGGYSLEISPQKQARHVEGTKEYERYCEKAWEKYGKKPSVLYGGLEKAQELVDKYAGTGKIEHKDGTIHPVETVEAQEPVGKYWDLKAERYVETHRLRLRYTRKDVHCYPVWGGDEDARAAVSADRGS